MIADLTYEALGYRRDIDGELLPPKEIQMKDKQVVQKSAVLSEDGKYRYRLDRWWGPGNRLVFLMMNPSTADAEKDDATIRKCMGFARRWNYDGITVVNLFALRSRSPKALLSSGDTGWDAVNFSAAVRALLGQREVICAWGCEDTLRQGRLIASVTQFVDALRETAPGTRFMCFGLTKGGTPRHPLMLAYSTMAQEYS